MPTATSKMKEHKKELIPGSTNYTRAKQLAGCVVALGTKRLLLVVTESIVVVSRLRSQGPQGSWLMTVLGSTEAHVANHHSCVPDHYNLHPTSRVCIIPDLLF